MLCELYRKCGMKYRKSFQESLKITGCYDFIRQFLILQQHELCAES
ncbi:hypothetical protein QSI_3612 [Clostridioides difficile P28]|nr:hypothetical protein QSI_3612 [Clostridioides difficile P28]